MLQGMARDAQDDRGAFLDILEVDPKNAQETMAERVHSGSLLRCRCLAYFGVSLALNTDVKLH